MRHDPFAMGEAVTGSAYIMATPAIQVTLQKTDNGYSLLFIKQPQAQPVPPIAPADEAVEGVVETSEDEQIDTMVEGLQAFLRAIHGEEGDGAWRGEDEKAKIRKAIKAINGQRASVYRSYNKPAPQPEVKQLVFESKAKLLEFLDKNL